MKTVERIEDPCAECPLDCRPVNPQGVATAKYLIVVKGIASHSQVQSGSNLTPASMGLVIKTLEEYGFDRKEFVITSIVRCQYDPTRWVAKDKKEIHKRCREYLLRVIDRMKPEVIIPMGADAASAVFGRAVKITKVRGVAEYVPEYDTMVLPMMEPSQVVVYPQHRPIFASDCKTLARLVEHNYDLEAIGEEVQGDYQIVDDLQFLIDENPEALSFDLETTGLRWQDTNNKILTLQLCPEPGRAYMVVWDHPEAPASRRQKAKIKQQLKTLLQNPTTSVLGQNLKYDQMWVLTRMGFRFRIDHDTLMLAALVDENSVSKDLDTLTKIYAPDMAGYADCVHPDTLLLMEDLSKKKAKYIREGDKVVGFEEYPSVEKASRKIIGSTVCSVRTLRMPSYLIVMEDGRKIQVSMNHQFLKGPKKGNYGGSWTWRRADTLRVGDYLKMFPFPDEGFGFDDGWMSGILDGEGYVTKHGNAGIRLGFCQSEGAVLTRGLQLFNKGKDLQVSWDVRKRIANVTITGYKAMSEMVRLRPTRLIEKRPWEGKGLFVGEESKVRIMSIDYVGLQEVVSIQTTTKTFIANGFSTHNCFNAKWDKERMDLVPLKELKNYGCSDVDACFRVLKELASMVFDDRKLWNHYRRVSMPGINAFVAMEHRGMLIDEDALDDFEMVLEEDVNDTKTKLLAQVPRSIKRKHIDKGLNFTRADFVRDILFSHPDGFKLTPKVFTESTRNLPNPSMWVPSTSTKDHLPWFYEECPFTVDLAEWIKSDRLLNTNVRRFREQYITDGKVHSVYSLWTAVTGRSSSQSPNGQNYPKRGKKAKAYRRIFVSPPGYALLEADLSQAELRIAGDMANEPTMIHIYNTGGDIHTYTATIVMGLTMEQFLRLPKSEQKLARFKAKACIAEGELVLTDKGLVPIENVTLDHKVWDGVEWVTHGGVICNGYREVISYEGITATPDHEVFTEDGRKIPIGELASSLCRGRIFTSGNAEIPLRNPKIDRFDKEGWGKKQKICGSNMRKVQETEMGSCRQYKGKKHENMHMSEKDKVWGRYSCQTFRAKIRQYGSEMRTKYSRKFTQLQRKRDKSTIRVTEEFCIMGTDYFPGYGFQGYGFRQNRQFWRLLQRESTISNQKRKSIKQGKNKIRTMGRRNHVSHTLGAEPITLRGKTNILSTTEGLNHKRHSGKSDSYYKKSFWEMGGHMVETKDKDAGRSEKDKRNNSKKVLRVYDIVDAGPRHRFTVSNKLVSNCNFGFLYGMGWRKFIGYAKTQYGIEFTAEEAQRIRNGFFSMYRKLPLWHKAMREFVQEHGFVRSYSGRIRHLPMIASGDEKVRAEAERQAINSPVQGFGSDLGIMSIGRIDQEIDPEYLSVIGFVHDAIYALVPDKYVEWGAKTLKHYMESNPLEEWFGRKMKVPIVADVSFGWNGAEMYEMGHIQQNVPYCFGGLEEKVSEEEGKPVRFGLPRQEVPPNAGRIDTPEHMVIHV